MVTSLVAYQTCSMFMPIGHHTMYGQHCVNKQYQESVTGKHNNQPDSSMQCSNNNDTYDRISHIICFYHRIHKLH